MGGGGGPSRRLTSDDLRLLEQAARESLREAAPPKRRNLFISFAGEDLDLVNLLRGQAKNKYSDLDFIDRSVQVPFDSENAEYIRRRIREHIRQASVILVFVSEETAKSRWVDWEVRESIRLGKGVIAMYAGDSSPRNLPSAIREHGIRLVPWDHDRISAAIDEAARERGPGDLVKGFE